MLWDKRLCAVSYSFSWKQSNGVSTYVAAVVYLRTIDTLVEICTVLHSNVHQSKLMMAQIIKLNYFHS